MDKKKTANLNHAGNSGKVTKEYSAILKKFRKGDTDAFEYVYMQWRKPICLFLSKFTNSGDDAEDLTQDVFATLWDIREKVDATKDIRSLIYVIARRSMGNYLRRQQTCRDYLDNEDFTPGFADDAYDIIVAQEIEILTQYATETMPKKQREVFELSYYKGLTNAQIADRLGISNDAVRTHLKDARKHINGILLRAVLILPSLMSFLK